MRVLAVLLAVGAVGVLLVVALAGESRLSGPVLVTLGDSHGLHAGDLVSVALALCAVVSVLALARRP